MLGPIIPFLLKVEQGLGLNHRHLLRIGRERVDVQLLLSCLEVDIAERLQAAGFQRWEFDKHAAIAGEPLKVDMALPIQIRTHPLDLKVGHIIYPPAQGALVRPWAAELEALNQTSLRQRLTRRAYNLAEAHIARKHTDNVGAARNPDKRLVLFGFQLPLGVNLEKLRMQGPLEETEYQFLDSYIDLR